MTEALHEALKLKSKVNSDDLRKDFPVGKKTDGGVAVATGSAGNLEALGETSHRFREALR